MRALDSKAERLRNITDRNKATIAHLTVIYDELAKQPERNGEQLTSGMRRTCFEAFDDSVLGCSKQHTAAFKERLAAVKNRGQLRDFIIKLREEFQQLNLREW